MDLIIGATSKVAREYVNHLVEIGVDSYLVSRSGNQNIFPRTKNIRGHLVQDLASSEWEISDFLKNGDFSRVIYFAAVNTCKPEFMQESFEVNYNAVSRIIDSILPRDLQFSYISTDMVFTDNDFCDENKIPLSPFGEYGRLKRKGEIATLSYGNGLVVRLGNVIGTRKDFLTNIACELNKGQKIPVWTNVYNVFTGINDVFLVLDKLREYLGSQRVFHAISRGEPLSRHELARDFVYFCVKRGILPKDSLDRINPVKANLRDGRPSFLGLTNEITERELGISSGSLFESIESSMSRGYPYLIKIQ